MKNLLIPFSNKILISAATFLFIIFIFDFSAKASTFTSAASGNWNSTSSWTFSGSDGDGIPDANDIVTIGSGHTITITAPAECTSLTFLADASACSVIISGSNLLTVSGEIAINNDNDDTHKLLAVNSGTLNAGSIDINGGNGQKVSELSISTGTINVTGNFTDGNSGNSLLTFTGSGIINAGGGGANSFGNFNFTPSTSTVNYNSTGAQTVRGTTYYNLILSNSATKTSGNDIIVSGNLLIEANATFTMSNDDLTVNGTTTINGTLAYSSNQGTKTFNGAITVASGGSWDNTAGESFQIKNNLTNDGSFNAGTAGTFTFNGASAQTIGGSNPITFNNVTINNSAGATLSANQTINGALTFTNGNFNTGSNSVAFGTTGSVGGEGAGKYLVGNLTTSRNVGTGSNNFGGIGVNIGSGLDNLGNVSITRISGTSGTVSANGNEGINRRWVISSASPPSSGRTISFSWVSSDDNGVILTEAWAFRSTDNGVTWNPEGLVQDVSSTRTITVITNSFSIWTVADESGPLPVELYSFTASQKGNDVILNWTTKTEVNNYGFEIEKAVGSKELEVGSWSKIGFVKGNGNSNSPKKYSFVDNKLTFGKYSYRLKQIDTDGGFEYSKVVEVNISVTDNFRLEQNYPNPFNPKTIIKYSIPFESNVTIKLHNILGETIQSLLNKFIQPGEYQLEFIANNLSSGIYIYSIEIAGTNGTVLHSYRKMILNK